MTVALALLIAVAGFFSSVAWAQDRLPPEAPAVRQGQPGARAKPVAEAARAGKTAPPARPARPQTDARGDGGRTYQFPLKPYVQSNGAAARSPVICACIAIDGQA